MDISDEFKSAIEAIKSQEDKVKKKFKGLLDYTVIFSALSNSSFIQYCDSNIGLLSFASYKVIALPTIAKAIVVALLRS